MVESVVTARAPDERFLASLERELGLDGAVSRTEEDRAFYGRDWTRVYAPDPTAIVFPQTTAHVATIMRLCRSEGVALVPSGGRTGLAAGAVAAHGELVMSMERMRRMDAVDRHGATVRVQAGAVTQAVHDHARSVGLTWPVDFASKGQSQVGGNIATNAGGVRVIRYGLTRQWVLGLEVVTGAGEILELGGALEKNNTGIDLRQLFIGSEGILGVVTEATLKLTRLPVRVDVFLFALSDLPAALRFFEDVRHGPFTVMAFELFTQRCYERVARHRKVHAPFDKPSECYVLLEVEGADEAVVERWLESVVDRELVEDGVRAQHGTQARALWELREGISESLSATGTPHKNDVALPISALEPFVQDLERVFATEYPGWEICVFGHIGDGNLHVNVMKPDVLDVGEFRVRTHEADHTLFELVRRHRGSISAEHGIGLLKKEFLSYTRSPEEIALMQKLKATLDPAGILNPGKVFDVPA